LPVIDGDSSQLWQVAMNLLLNASEALDGKPGTISLSTSRITAGAGELAEFLSVKPLEPGVYVLLEVRDTGHGMSPEVLARIFDPFFSTKAKGRGLGLSAVVGIVQAHGGGITVRSTHNVGTVFRIVLPQTTETTQPELAPTAVLAPAEPAAGQAKRLLLLAEDDPDIRKVTIIALRTAGYEVMAAENGRVAVDLFVQRAKDVRVVLLDQEMPVMNGEETFRAIRAIREDVPIVVMTGYGAVAAQAHFGHLHPTGVLGKPFTRAQLLEVLGLATRLPAGAAES
jgi:CheY-like chemotaxis protein